MTDLAQMIGSTVQQICLDYQVTLQISGPDGGDLVVDASLSIEAPFRLTTPEGIVDITPGEPASYTPICQLLHTRVSAISLSDTYNLVIGFEPAFTLAVSPRKHLDAWQMSGTGVPELFVGPGQFSGT